MTFDGWADAKKVCVIGAGTMGSGITAHLANLGFEVDLLDSTREIAQVGFERSCNSRPPHYYLPETASKVRVGSTGDNLEWVTEADWVCEVVTERLNVKRTLLEKLDALIRPDAMVTTNTSGLPISLLAEGRSESFRRRFMGTHFFNPPRYLKLLELIPTADTDPEAIKAMTTFLEGRCARRVVVAKDTPGFIANRFGMWSLYHAIHTAERLHFSVEEVDAVTGPFLGRPRSATFRLADVIGLDVMQDIAQNLLERTGDDPGVAVFESPKSLKHLWDRGLLGEKVGKGYYRREGKEYLSLDLNTFAYRQRHEVRFASLESLAPLPLGGRVRSALDARDEAGEFLRNHLIPVLQYADRIRNEISHSIQDFDEVLCWGFGWDLGPFEMIDAIGADRLGIATKQKFYEGRDKVLSYQGSYIPIKREEQYRQLGDFEIESRHENFQVRDLGDGVGALCLTTKNGMITRPLVDELTRYLDRGKFGRLVLSSEGRSFSVGYDLSYFLDRITSIDVSGIEAALKALQELGEALERHVVVAAVHGYCLGTGLEMALSCSKIVSFAEAMIGLPESRVGLIPGGRGTVLMRLYNGPTPRKIAEAAYALTEGHISANADEARAQGYLRATDLTIYHPDRLITRAKEEALKASPVVRPEWKPVEGPLPGMIDRLLATGRSAGKLSEYDEVIGGKIKTVFAKAITYEEACERERIEFAELCFRALSQARIKHMLDNSRPLRN